MITFLITVKHPKLVKNWQSVSNLLAATLESILAQSSQDFKVAVVCNAMPDNAITSKFIKYLIVDLPCPNRLCEEDKTQKILLGFAYAKAINPDYFMVFDADDFVHKGLVEFVVNNPHEYGYYINQGYISDGENLIFLVKDFQEYCGSALIVRAKYFMEFINRFGYLHTKIKHLDPIPFSGVIYNICNGENFSASQIIRQPLGSSDVQFLTVPLTSEIIENFNFRN